MKNKRTKKFLNVVQIALLTLAVFGTMAGLIIDGFFNNAHAGIIILVGSILAAIGFYMQRFINKL